MVGALLWNAPGMRVPAQAAVAQSLLGVRRGFDRPVRIGAGGVIHEEHPDSAGQPATDLHAGANLARSCNCREGIVGKQEDWQKFQFMHLLLDQFSLSFGT